MHHVTELVLHASLGILYGFCALVTVVLRRDPGHA